MVHSASHAPTHAKRLDIQGLRALSVAMVVLFHLRATMLPGGYIGVDVFFVISGFLITGQMLREVSATGSLRITEFWARRVRRLLPAAFLVLIFSAVAILFLFPKTAWPQNLTEIAFASVYLLNFRLASDSVDYLARDNHPSIAQHYWSLSVEEQFYIVVPLLIIAAVWVARRWGKFNHRQILVAVLLVVGVASFAYSIYDTSVSRSSAYFVTTTRAWEFALGGLVALAPELRPRKWHHPLSWAALGVMVVCAFLFNDQTEFPGYMAALPVVAAAVLLWMGDSGDFWAPQWLTHNRLVQIVGDTSYSIYLWHWPLIIIYIQLRGAPGWKAMLALSVLMVVLSAATKYLVEDPIRHAPGFLKRQVPTFSLMAAGMALMGAMTLVPIGVIDHQSAQKASSIKEQATDSTGCFGANAVVNDCDNPYAWTDTVDPSAALKEAVLEWELPAECRMEKQAGWEEFTCDYVPNGEAKRKFFLVGDSHAWAMYPGLAEAAKKEGWALSARIRMACGPFVRGMEASEDAHARRCSVFNAGVEKEIEALPSDVTVVMNQRTDPPGQMGDDAQHLVDYTTGMARDYIDRLAQDGKQSIVVRAVPGMEFLSPRQKGPDCVAMHEGEDDPCTWKRPATDWLIDAVKSTPAKVINTDNLLCTDGTCHTLVGGTVVYSDDNHLTLTFSRSMASWWIRELG